MEVRTTPGRGFPAFSVRNPLHDTRYEVYAPTYPEEWPWMCGCPDYAHRGAGRCKHIDGVRSWLVDHPLPTPAATSEDRGRNEARQLAALLKEIPTSDHDAPPRRLRWGETVLNPATASREERSRDGRSAGRGTRGPE